MNHGGAVTRSSLCSCARCRPRSPALRRSRRHPFPHALAAAAIEPLGQQIIIENRPGATQIIGAQAAAKATPDGYTLFFGSVTSLAINPASRAHPTYDPLRDFAPLTFCFSTPLYLVVHQAVPARSVKEQMRY
jgi:tripartite-type tricarboxylate transporter receptor subunit TctC